MASPENESVDQSGKGFKRFIRGIASPSEDPHMSEHQLKNLAALSVALFIGSSVGYYAIRHVRDLETAWSSLMRLRVLGWSRDPKEIEYGHIPILYGGQALLELAERGDKRAATKLFTSLGEVLSNGKYGERLRSWTADAFSRPKDGRVVDIYGDSAGFDFPNSGFVKRARELLVRVWRAEGDPTMKGLFKASISTYDERFRASKIKGFDN